LQTLQNTDLEVKDLGMIEYEKGLHYQRECVDAVLKGDRQKIILCEHPAVLTLGRMAKNENILASSEELSHRFNDVIDIDRGGDITLHSPGQLVVYPILNLVNYKKDLHYYLRNLEQVAIDLLKEFDIVSHSIKSLTGVWVESEKIASIGIGVKKWISYHGISLNVNTDLSLYSCIRPCGLNIQMTSIANILGSEIDMKIIKEKFMECFLRIF